MHVCSKGHGVLSSTQQHDGGPSVVTRILLVDDDPHLVPLIQRGLAYEGFEVYTAMDGESGLDAARTHQPHIVLLDLVCRLLLEKKKGSYTFLCTTRLC